jgi:GxxExxY protein
MDEIIECIKRVEKELGNYYKENIYQFALYTELNLSGYLVQSEVIVPIFYKGVYVGFERSDLVIYNKEGKIEYILELKSQGTRVGSKEVVQLKKYLKNLNCNNGILVNFHDSLEIMHVTHETSRKI